VNTNEKALALVMLSGNAGDMYESFTDKEYNWDVA